MKFFIISILALSAAGCSRDLALKTEPIYDAQSSSFSCSYSAGVVEADAEALCGRALADGTAPMGLFIAKIKLVEEGNVASSKRIIRLYVNFQGQAGSFADFADCPETDENGEVNCCAAILPGSTTGTATVTITNPEGLLAAQTCATP